MLSAKYGPSKAFGKSRLYQFGRNIACSINYSKLIRGHRFFFGLAGQVIDSKFIYPATETGDYVLLVCGSADTVLCIPRDTVISMLQHVTTRKVDVFRDGSDYIMQTTGHPKLRVTEFLNNFPTQTTPVAEKASAAPAAEKKDREHVAIQGALIALGRAEGCKVWVPPADRNFAFETARFTTMTLERLPNFGFDEFSRRIIQNIDVLWLSGNVISKAFEVESSTSIYSGLLRLNDLALAQPNNRIDLAIVARKARRHQVYKQLLRPSFRELSLRCGFLSVEQVTEQIDRLKALRLGQQGRVSGLLKAERFEFPEESTYPSDL